jgi:dTDP-4-dehydrorhamnose reductase
MVGVSTDFVFAGGDDAPYREDARPDPISEYGRSKRAGEVEIMAAQPGFAVARTSWLYGGPGKHFPRTVLSTIQRRGEMDVVDDEIGSPTFAGDLADALVRLLERRPAGVLHLSNVGSASRFDFARAIVDSAGMNPEAVRPVSTEVFLQRFPLPARRPSNSTLSNTRAAALGIELPPWEDSLRGYVPQLARELGLA